MSYLNSTKSSETSVTVPSFTLKRENSTDFLCMNAMHTSVSSLFVTPNPGILQGRCGAGDGTCVDAVMHRRNGFFTGQKGRTNPFYAFMLHAICVIAGL
jgi:hypothetical protein